MTNVDLDEIGGMTRGTAHSQASFRCAFEAINDAMAQIAGFAELAKLASEETIKLQLVIEELMTNSIRHGGATSESQIEVELLSLDDRVTIQYVDHGKPFDPIAYQPPSPEDQGDAGYGWVLIRGICRDIAYSREGTLNKMSLALPLGTIRAQP